MEDTLFTFKIETELLQAAREAAKDDDRSLSAYIRNLIRQDIERRNPEPAATDPVIEQAS